MSWAGLSDSDIAGQPGRQHGATHCSGALCDQSGHRIGPRRTGAGGGGGGGSLGGWGMRYVYLGECDVLIR